MHLNVIARERARSVGADPDALIGRPLADVWPAMAAALGDGPVGDALAERKSVRVELPTPYRRHGWVDAHAVAIGSWLALLVRDASDERTARLRVERLQALTAQLSEALTPAQVAHVALNTGMSVLGAAGGGVVLRVGDDEAALVADAGFDASHTRDWTRFSLTAPYPVSDAIRERALVFMRGLEEWRARYPALAPAIAASGYEAYAAAPLEVDGRVLGAINYNFRDRRAFDDADRAFLLGIARQAAQALERARLYDALRASEERFRLASEATAGGLYDWEVGADRVERSRDFADIVGEDGEKTSTDLAWWRSLVHPDDVDHGTRVVRAALGSTAAGYEVEYRVRHRDGRWIWVLDRGRIVRDAEGRAVRVVGGTSDVSARRAAAEERERLLDAERAARQELEAANARLREQAEELEAKAEEAERARAEAESARQRIAFLAEASERLASSLDAETTITEVVSLAVPTVADWAAYNVDAGDGTVRTVAIHHPDPAMQTLARVIGERYPMRADDPAGVAKVLRTGEPELMRDIPDAVLEAVAHDAEHLRLLRGIGFRSIMNVPLLANGRVIGALGFGTGESGRRFGEADLAFAVELARRAATALEHARLYGEAQAARRDAESANRAKSDFMGTMSHELRTPLNAIQGYVELLSLGLRGPLTEAQRQDLERVRRANQYLTGLVTDVLNFARLEAGQVEFRIAALEIGAVIADIESLLGPQLAAKGVTFSHDGCAPDTPDQPHVVRADPEKLRQILVNLLSNAVKFTDAGGHVALACETDVRADVVRLRVSDTGRGIAPEQLARVFEPFVQVDRHRTPGSQQGVGLGLAISRDLARRMAGDLTVESALGAGSTFTLTLPRG